MKAPALFAVMLGFSTIVAVPPSFSDEKKAISSARSSYDKGVAAYKSGKLESAKIHFGAVLREVPGHTYSKRYLTLIRKAEIVEMRKPALEKKLDRIVLPKVDMEDTALEDAVDYIRRKTGENSPDKKAPNFILRVSEDKALQSVNMKLEQVPVSELLRYLSSISGTRVTYEPHAIVISDHSSARSTPPGKATTKPVVQETNPFKTSRDPFSR